MKSVKELLNEMEAYKEDQRQLMAPLIAQALAEARAKERQASELKVIPKSQRPLCGARTRSGGTCQGEAPKFCQARALHGSERCRLHGGKPSTLTAAYRRHLREEAAYLRSLVAVCRALLG